MFLLQLKQLVKAIMSVILPKSASREQVGNQNGTSQPEKQPVDVTHVASQTLVMILGRWSNSVNQLKEETVNALRECLRDRSTLNDLGQPHVNVLRALMTLGPQVTASVVLPEIKDYAAFITERMDKASKESKSGLMTLFQTLAMAARSILSHFSGQESMATHYVTMSEVFGDALGIISCSNKIPIKAIPDQDLVGRLRIKPLGPKSSPRTTPQKTDRTPSSSTDNMFSKNDMDSFAGLGVPTDIFEPAQGTSPDKKAQLQRLLQTRPDLTPKKISSQVKVAFDTSNERTVSRYPTITLKLPNAKTRDQLKRKTLQVPVAHFKPKAGTKLQGCLGRRLNYKTPTERFKAQRLMTCSLQSVL